MTIAGRLPALSDHCSCHSRQHLCPRGSLSLSLSLCCSSLFSFSSVLLSRSPYASAPCLLAQCDHASSSLKHSLPLCHTKRSFLIRHSLIPSQHSNHSLLTYLDVTPPVWSSTWNPHPWPPLAPPPRVGVQNVFCNSTDAVTLQWDVALDLNRVGYALCMCSLPLESTLSLSHISADYQTTPFDFTAAKPLGGATRVVRYRPLSHSRERERERERKREESPDERAIEGED